jgi:hypothetical protein
LAVGGAAVFDISEGVLACFAVDRDHAQGHTEERDVRISFLNT